MDSKRMGTLWLNEEAQGQLSMQEQTGRAENPVGAFDLIETELAEIIGGANPHTSLPSMDPFTIVVPLCCQ